MLDNKSDRRISIPVAAPRLRGDSQPSFLDKVEAAFAADNLLPHGAQIDAAYLRSKYGPEVARAFLDSLPAGGDAE